MNNKKNVFSLMYVLLLGIIYMAAVSCSEKDKEDDNEQGGTLKGWYTNLSLVAKQSDFNKINQAINNNEELSSYKYGGVKHTYIASRDLFIDSNGMYHDTDAHFGRLRFSIQMTINVIRIMDDNTLLSYVGWLYQDGANSDEALYKFYAGSIFGNMTYYGTPTYYTYARVDKKLIVSNGDIYTIIEGQLIKDGSSTRLSKYDPSKRY